MRQFETPKTIGIGILVLALFGTPIASAQECDAVLPTYEIATPKQDVPEAYERFLGLWGNGKWDDKLCHKLVVESVDMDGNVSAIYSWGVYEGWGLRRPSYLRRRGRYRGRQDDPLSF